MPSAKSKKEDDEDDDALVSEKRSSKSGAHGITSADISLATTAIWGEIVIVALLTIEGGVKGDGGDGIVTDKTFPVEEGAADDDFDTGVHT